MEFENQITKKFKEIKNGIENLAPEPINFRTHVLPLARIKKIMKLDEEVKMISAETPLLISKACELFIIELAYRGWIHTIESNRRTLQRCKNKLFYSAHSYSKNPSVPIIGLFDNYYIIMNDNNEQGNNINFNNNINNFNES